MVRGTIRGLFELSGHVIDRVVEVLGCPKSVKSWLRHDTSTPDKLADNNVAIFEYDKALAVITLSAKMSGATEICRGDFKELARAIKSGQPLKHSYDHELLLQETLLRASGELS